VAKTDTAFDHWIFDLDNTLYPAECAIFDQMNINMWRFMQSHLGVSEDDARALQKHYFHSHGSTLRGLMIEHGVPPQDFLEVAHQVDLAGIPPDLRLRGAISALPGRCLIFTSATVAHAENILSHLGIADLFEDIFDIHAAEYLPKPHPPTYDKMVERLRVTAERAIFFEDVARNLEPAAALGMTTVWISGERLWGGDGSAESYVHHVAEDLADWLLSR